MASAKKRRRARAKPVLGYGYAIRSDECGGLAGVDGALVWSSERNVPPIRHASETVVKVEIREVAPRRRKA